MNEAKAKDVSSDRKHISSDTETHAIRAVRCTTGTRSTATACVIFEASARRSSAWAFSPSPWKAALLDVVDFCIGRTH